MHTLKNRNKRRDKRNTNILASSDVLFSKDKFKKLGQSKSVKNIRKNKSIKYSQKINKIDELNNRAESKKTISQLNRYRSSRIESFLF